MTESVLMNTWPRLARVGAIAAALLAAGCGALPDKPARAALFDFGPGAMKSAPAAAAPTAPLPPIALGDVDANPRLDGTQMLYRLVYADGNELRPYAQSRWSLAPAQLLRQRLRDGLAEGHTVLGSDESATMARATGRQPDVLRVSLEEFSQVFDAPGSSVGLIRASATLTRNGASGDKVLAQRVFAVQRPAPSADAPGGVKALIAASDALVAEIVAWVDQQPK